MRSFFSAAFFPDKQTVEGAQVQHYVFGRLPLSLSLSTRSFSEITLMLFGFDTPIRLISALFYGKRMISKSSSFFSGEGFRALLQDACYGSGAVPPFFAGGPRSRSSYTIRSSPEKLTLTRIKVHWPMKKFMAKVWSFRRFWVKGPRHSASLI